MQRMSEMQELQVHLDSERKAGQLHAAEIEYLGPGASKV